MKNNFTFKHFKNESLEKLSDSVNYYLVKNNVSLEKVGVTDVSFFKEGDEYHFIFASFDIEFRSGKALRVKFFEQETIGDLVDKMNFYIKGQKLPHDHIIDHNFNTSNDVKLSYVYHLVPEK